VPVSSSPRTRPARQTFQGWLDQRARERADQAARNAVAMHRVAAAAAARLPESTPDQRQGPLDKRGAASPGREAAPTTTTRNEGLDGCKT